MAMADKEAHGVSPGDGVTYLSEEPAPVAILIPEQSRVTPLSPGARRRFTVRRSRVQATAVFVDIVAIVVALCVGSGIGSLWHVGAVSLPPGVSVTLVLLASLLLHGMYRGNGLRLLPTGTPVLSVVGHSLPVAMLGSVGLFFALGWAHSASAAFAVPACLLLPSALSIPLARSLVSHIGARYGVGRKQRVLVIGAGEVADHVMGRLERHGLITALGMVDDDPLPGFETIGALRDVPDLCDTLDVDRIIVALPRAPWLDVSEVIQPLVGCVDVAVVPSLYELVTWRSGTADLAGMPLIPLMTAQSSLAARLAKRAVDLVVGTVVLIMSLPLIAAVAVAIKVDSPGPVFFRQARAGKEGKTFSIWKFRTMVVDAETKFEEVSAANPPAGHRFKATHDPRVTKVGTFLRRFSLDELPQLFNVLRGTMALVGPRPFPLDQARAFRLDPAVSRFAMSPGMTGLWQVSGRSDLSWDDLCRLDSVYVSSWSFLWDLRILVQTPAAVLRRRGAY